MEQADAVDRILILTLAVAGPLLLWAALLGVPFRYGDGITSPLSMKLFFFHVPVAFTSFAAFGLALCFRSASTVASDLSIEV